MTARKPTALKELAGEKRPSRLNAREPRPLLELPRVPASLSKIAADEWKRIARILYDVRVLTRADLAMLRGYCVNFAWAFEAEQMVVAEGVTIREMRGSGENTYTIKKENPSFAVAQKAYKQMAEFARELGLSPVARSKVSAQEEKESAPVLAFDRAKSTKSAK